MTGEGRANFASAGNLLEAHVDISDEEFQRGELSPENLCLGVMLLHMRGYVVLRNAVPKAVIAEMRSAFELLYSDTIASHADGLCESPEEGIGESGTVFWERGARFRIFPKLRGPFANPRILRNVFADAIMRETLGPGYYCKFVSSDTCVKGSTLQAPHRDIGFYDEKRTFGCIVNIPIMHCGLHNGPTEVWPGGSHLWRSEMFYRFNLHPFIQDGLNPDVEALARHIPSTKIELIPGELLIRDPGMWHRGTPNETEEPRTMLTSGYFRKGYYYRYGDPFYNLDPELYGQLDPNVRELFAPFFDRSDTRYWRLRWDRALTRVSNRRFVNAPLRGAVRLALRLKQTNARCRRGAHLSRLAQAFAAHSGR